MKKMILKIQLFAPDGESLDKYDGFSDRNNDYTVGVSANLDTISTAYSYLNGLCSTVDGTIGDLSSIQVLPGVSANGEYEDSLKCLKGSNGLVGISQAAASARQRAENVIRAIITAEGGTEEDFNNYINQLKENFDNSFAGDLDDYINYDYLPTVRDGKINTHMYEKDAVTILFPIKYEGEYLEFENPEGITVQVPLAKTVYKDGKVTFEKMTPEEKAQYIPKVTEYYNKSIEAYDKCSDKFKNETGDRVSSVTMLYIDPDSRDYMDHHEAAAYCQAKTRVSNQSDIIIFSDDFIDVNNPYSDANTQYCMDYMVFAYVHEFGHAYANNNHVFPDRDSNREWKEIYNQVASEPVNSTIMRDYSMTNDDELFADATAYYFTDPDRLKMIDIDVNGYDNLYQYMDTVLN